MRKSLGAKRKELGEADIDRIVKLYGAFEANEWSKVFDNDDFGYRTITVERPLRLNFAVSPERVARLDEVTALAKLGKDLPKLKAALATLDAGQGLEGPGTVPEGRQEGAGRRRAYLWPRRRPRRSCRPYPSATRPPRSAPTARATRSRTPTCATPRTCRSRTTCRAYFEREVLPHVPDAWIDHDKTKVGYEIPFTRHFYKYVPPRPLEEIDARSEGAGRRDHGAAGGGDGVKRLTIPRLSESGSSGGCAESLTQLGRNAGSTALQVRESGETRRTATDGDRIEYGCNRKRIHVARVRRYVRLIAQRTFRASKTDDFVISIGLSRRESMVSRLFEKNFPGVLSILQIRSHGFDPSFTTVAVHERASMLRAECSPIKQSKGIRT